MTTAIDPRLLRHCDWPGCTNHYQADTGPTDRGWHQHPAHIRTCPTHSAFGHQPGFVADPDDRTTVTAMCECGASKHITQPTLGKIKQWWQTHTTTTRDGAQA